MPRLRGQRLHPESGQSDADCYGDGCWSPLSPPVSQPAPAPAPAPPPSWWSSPEPCPPDFAPSPSPVPTASWVHEYGSPPGGGGGDDHRRRLPTSAIAAVAAIAFVSLILLGVSVVVRRRQVRRRRQQALLAAPAAAPAAPTDADDPEGGGGGGVVHHVWYIRTVGLDEAAIGSIAATRYRAGAGLLGAADCTVCLGEFQDGELVRLLPKCGHAFHVPCIDTWLRAHVNCPLCRSDVLDPAVTTDTGGGGESGTTPPADPVEDDNAAAEQEDATSEAMEEHEREEGDHRGPSHAEEDQHEQPSLPEPLPQLPRPLPHNVRRAASMDAAIVSTAADVAAALERSPEAAPEEEQSGRRKRGTGPSCAKASDSGHRSNLSTDRPASAGIPRSFFSRHCRARSSVSPL